MSHFMGQPATKQNQEIERFEARISADKKTVLKNAADLSGRTLTDFVMNSAYAEAIRVIQEYQQLRLSVVDREVFIQALLNPPSASKDLLKAASAYKKYVESK